MKFSAQKFLAGVAMVGGLILSGKPAAAQAYGEPQQKKVKLETVHGVRTENSPTITATMYKYIPTPSAKPMLIYEYEYGGDKRFTIMDAKKNKIIVSGKKSIKFLKEQDIADILKPNWRFQNYPTEHSAWIAPTLANPKNYVLVEYVDENDALGIVAVMPGNTVTGSDKDMNYYVEDLETVRSFDPRRDEKHPEHTLADKLITFEKFAVKAVGVKPETKAAVKRVDAEYVQNLMNAHQAMMMQKNQSRGK